MLYEIAFPALLVGAKTAQFSRRAKARLGIGPRDMARITYAPDSYYRVTCWRLRRLDVNLLIKLAPMKAARLSVDRFERTKRMAPRNSFEKAQLVPEAQPTRDVFYRGKRVHMRMFGPDSGPKILALHGWNGRASMLRKLCDALAGEGYHVIVPDLPGHGKSEGNRYSFYDLGQAVADIYKTDNFEAVIGHSAGGLIAAIGLGRGLNAKRFIPIGAPASLSNLLKSYVDITQMPEKSLVHIERYYTKRYGLAPATVGPDLVSSLKVSTLVVHDKSDWQVGEENARQLVEAAQDGELLLTEGYTHLSVLNAPSVHDRIAAFLKRGAHA